MDEIPTDVEKKEQKEEKRGMPLRYAVIGFILFIIVLAGVITFYDVVRDKGDKRALEEQTLKHIQILNSRDTEAFWDLLTTKSQSLLKKDQVEQFMSHQADQNILYELVQIDKDGINVDSTGKEATVKGIIKVTDNGIILNELTKALTISLSKFTIKKTEQGLLFTHEVTSDRGSWGQYEVLFTASDETSLLEKHLEGIDPVSIIITFTQFQNGLIVTYKIPGDIVLTVYTPPTPTDTPSFYMYLQKEGARETIIPKTKKCETQHMNTLSFLEYWRKENGIWKYVEKSAEHPKTPQTTPPPTLFWLSAI
jgi:hypothetical protein